MLINCALLNMKFTNEPRSVTEGRIKGGHGGNENSGHSEEWTLRTTPDYRKRFSRD